MTAVGKRSRSAQQPCSSPDIKCVNKGAPSVPLSRCPSVAPRCLLPFLRRIRGTSLLSMNDLNERLEHQKEPSKDTSRRQRSCGRSLGDQTFFFFRMWGCPGFEFSANRTESGGEMKLMVIWTQFALFAAARRAAN